MQTYYYVLASKQFLVEEEPIHEVLKERTRHYHEQEKEIDFWLVQTTSLFGSTRIGRSQGEVSQTSSRNYFH